MISPTILPDDADDIELGELDVAPHDRSLEVYNIPPNVYGYLANSST